MKTSTMVWVLVLVLVVIGLGWYFLSGSTSTVTPNGQTVSTNNLGAVDANSPSAGQTASSTAGSSAPMSATVTYGPNGFSPASVTIAKGGTVTFVAAAGADEMWIASDPHPTHQGYDGTTRAQHCAAGYTGPAPLDQCAAGTSFSFTFGKTGSFGYHNHGNPGDRGTVVVQ